MTKASQPLTSEATRADPTTDTDQLPKARPIPESVRKGVSAAEAMVELLRRHKQERTEWEALAASERGQTDRIAAAFALGLYKRRKTEGERDRALWQLLADEGIELITREGEPLTETIEAEADIVEWLPEQEDQPEHVVESIEPEIRLRGRQIHRAKLSCAAGQRAEPPAEEKPPAAEPQPAPIQPQPAPIESAAEPPQPAESRLTKIGRKLRLAVRSASGAIGKAAAMAGEKMQAWAKDDKQGGKQS